MASVTMMLWFAVLFFLGSAPGSESRLLPQEQLRVAKGLCEGEALLASASALFVSSRSLLADSDPLPSKNSAPNVEELRVNGEAVDHGKQLSSPIQIASLQSSSQANDLKVVDSKVVINHPAHLTASETYSTLSTPSGGNDLMVEAVKKDRTLHGELLSKLSSSVPSGGDHLTVEKRHRSPPAQYQNLDSVPSEGGHLTVEKRHRSPPAQYQNLYSVPSGGDHLTVENRHRSPPAQYQNLDSVPSGGDHLTVEKRHRSPPAQYQNLDSVPSDGNHLTVEKPHRSPPSEYQTLYSSPSGGDHLTVEKPHRSPPAEYQTLYSSPSGGDHLTVEKPHRSPPAQYQTLYSSPSGGDHLTVEKRHRSPPAQYQNLESVPSGGDHLTVEAKHDRSPPAEYQKLLSVPSGGDHLRVQENNEPSQPAIGSEILANLQSSTPSCCNQLVVESKKTLAPPTDTSGLDLVSVEGLRNRNLGDSLVSKSGDQVLVEEPAPPSQTENFWSYPSDRSSQTPAPQSEMKHTQREASSVDTSQIVGCTDSIFDSLDMIAQQFANSIRRLAVYS
ncbi:hypothetical protein MPTK1_2g08870 [Marchantia polymorpha subsp. ruderalis]|nr:hypothetical protein Mp_2g08870 [Marchantia polymorpha subsp. ruderalis]